MNLKNLRNGYLEHYGLGKSRDQDLFAQTPKAVFAAIAFSLAMRICEDDEKKALAEVFEEWRILHENGIVPQKPKVSP